MGFTRQDYWNELQIPTPGDISKPGIEPVSLMSPGSLPLSHLGSLDIHILIPLSIGEIENAMCVSIFM